MPVFYFDIRNSHGKTFDDEGQDLSDLAAARQMAMDELTHLLSDEMPDGDIVSFAVTIRDADGTPVGTASTVVTYEDLLPP